MGATPFRGAPEELLVPPRELLLDLGDLKPQLLGIATAKVDELARELEHLGAQPLILALEQHCRLAQRLDVLLLVQAQHDRLHSRRTTAEEEINEVSKIVIAKQVIARSAGSAVG